MSSPLRNLRRNLVEAWFGPDREHMFALRIRLRILRLHAGLWWRRPKLAMIRHHWPKPIALLTVGIAVPIAFGWLLSLFFPEEANGLFAAIRDLLTDPQRSRLEWREAAQILLLLIGVPSAFLLWLFRDINVSGTLDNQRKDVNLKEFQEIQMRAAGAMDEKLPADARETLQIAALHQLRAFLRGEYGKSFRRPAFELLRARFVASAQATGTQAIHDWLEEWRRGAETDREGLPGRIETMTETVETAIQKLRPNRVAETERSILVEEWEAIFRSGMPLSGSTFDFIWLGTNALLAGAHLSSCRFISAFLSGVHFENAILFNADLAFAMLYETHFEGASLQRAHLEGARLFSAHLERAQLGRAHLEGAVLQGARMDGTDLGLASLVRANLEGARLKGANLAHADLRGANLTDSDLTGANLGGARLDGAIIPLDPRQLSNCKSATFDDTTIFAENWDSLDTVAKDAARWWWVKVGARPADLSSWISRTRGTG